MLHDLTAHDDAPHTTRSVSTRRVLRLPRVLFVRFLSKQSLPLSEVKLVLRSAYTQDMRPRAVAPSVAGETQQYFNVSSDDSTPMSRSC